MIQEGEYFITWQAPCKVVVEDMPDVIFGVGVSSYLVAAILAFSNERSCGFVRTKIKSHGLMLEVEGPEEMPNRRNGLVDLENIASSQLWERYVRIIPSLKDCSSGALVCKPELTRENFSDGILLARVFEGDYRLSSGAEGNKYIDTVPMAVTYSSAALMAHAAISLCGIPDVIVAPPFGGASLGVMVALQTGIPLFVPRIHSVKDSMAKLDEIMAVARGPEHVLFVDDFFSTGSTLVRVLGSIASQCRIFSICAPRDVASSTPNLRTAYFSENGRLLLSSVCEGLLA